VNLSAYTHILKKEIGGRTMPIIEYDEFSEFQQKKQMENGQSKQSILARFRNWKLNF